MSESGVWLRWKSSTKVYMKAVLEMRSPIIGLPASHTNLEQGF